MLKLLKLLLGLLKKSKVPAANPSNAPKWLLNAVGEEGFHETGTNRGIEKYIALAHCGTLGDPWCAIFVNAMLEKAGFKGTRSPAARSFAHHDNFMKLDGPAMGCIVVMWRGARNGDLGHVFIYTGEDVRGVWGFGGNERDGVREVPHDRNRIVGYYWPVSAPKPDAIGPVLYSGEVALPISTKED